MKQVTFNSSNPIMLSSFQANTKYLLSCDEYRLEKLNIYTNTFDRANIFGTLKNITTRLKTSNIVYDKVLFRNCTFDGDSWFDGILFKACTFDNCTFSGRMRWCEFNECNIINTEFDMKYMRRTTFRKNCTYDNVKFNIEQIDEAVWLFGERHNERELYRVFTRHLFPKHN